jgi:hypothetical protein
MDLFRNISGLVLFAGKAAMSRSECRRRVFASAGLIMVLLISTLLISGCSGGGRQFMPDSGFEGFGF